MKKLFSIVLATVIIMSVVPIFSVSVSADVNNTVGGFLDRVKSDFDLVFYDEF